MYPMFDTMKNATFCSKGRGQGSGDVWFKGGPEPDYTKYTVGFGTANCDGSCAAYPAPARLYHKGTRLVHRIVSKNGYYIRYMRPQCWIFTACKRKFKYDACTEEGRADDKPVNCMLCLQA